MNHRNPTAQFQRFLLLLICCTALLSVEAQVAGGVEDWHTPLFKDGLSRSEAAQVAFPAISGEELDELATNNNLVIAPWSHRPGLYVAALLDVSGGEKSSVGGPVLLTVAVLKRVAEGVTRMAQGKHELEGIRWSNHLWLDLAPYRIHRDEIAFGVRLTTSYSSTSHSTAWTDLHLFRLAGEKITPIFETTVESNSTLREPNDDVTSFSKAVVIVGSVAANGFHDLIVKTTEGERSTENNKLIKQSVSEKHYRWNGTAYVSSK